MSRARPGPSFDQDYVAGQIQGHQELLAIQEHYLKSGSSNRELVAIARLAQNTIQEHLTLLQQIKDELAHSPARFRTTQPKLRNLTHRATFPGQTGGARPAEQCDREPEEEPWRETSEDRRRNPRSTTALMT